MIKTRKDGKPAAASSGEYQERVSLTLDPTTKQHLRQIYPASMSAGVRIAVAHFIKYQEGAK